MKEKEREKKREKERGTLSGWKTLHAQYVPFTCGTCELRAVIGCDVELTFSELPIQPRFNPLFVRERSAVSLRCARDQCIAIDENFAP